MYYVIHSLSTFHIVFLQKIGSTTSLIVIFRNGVLR
jgi:hypothetical protein